MDSRLQGGTRVRAGLFEENDLAYMLARQLQ